MAVTYVVGILMLLTGISIGIEIERIVSRRQRPLERLDRRAGARENGWAVLARHRSADPEADHPADRP